MKLALGTVQFGLDYGISNTHGKVCKSQVKDILEKALSLGINTLDCAGAYGDSEQVLGELIDKSDFNIITKIPNLSKNETSITEYFQQSLQNLKRDKVQTLLFHSADNLITHPFKVMLFQQLNKLKNIGLVNEIGVSVYTPKQLKSIHQQFSIDVAQVPINIFDQRFIEPSFIDYCSKERIKLHARSLFLQGLLLLDENTVPEYFLPFKDKLNDFSRLAQHLSCNKLTLALAILAQNSHNLNPHNLNDKFHVIEHIVVGVCNSIQLIEIVNAFEQAQKLAINTENLTKLADFRLELINPSLWPTSHEQQK